MNNDKLTQLKHYYNDATLDEPKVEALWQELAGKLPERQYHPFHYPIRYAASIMVMAIFLSSAALLIQAATPASPLYPVRMNSERALAKLTGRYDKLILIRTDEIINAAQRKSDAEIQQATEDYKKTLDEAKENKANYTPEAKASLKETLKDSEAKLTTITPTSNKGKNLLNKSLTETRSAQQEVKAAHTEEKNNSSIGSEKKSDNQSNGNSNSQGNNSNQGQGNRNNK
jgi:hypothetical protein